MKNFIFPFILIPIFYLLIFVCPISCDCSDSADEGEKVDESYHCFDSTPECINVFCESFLNYHCKMEYSFHSTGEEFENIEACVNIVSGSFTCCYYEVSDLICDCLLTVNQSIESHANNIFSNKDYSNNVKIVQYCDDMNNCASNILSMNCTPID